MTTKHPAHGPVSIERLYQSSACTRYAKYSAKQQHKATAVISATQWLML
ncbi:MULTISPECIES: hypothetical protein [Citrobacter]|nr:MULTISPECIES: hypothetical protein [Citrobacter]MBU3800483.1 hypothetical protein [Citrobacter youngae]MDM2719459.1 hypothetical protein [Citrobacter sp. Cy232]